MRVGCHVGISEELRLPAQLVCNLVENANINVSGLLGASILASTLLLLVHQLREALFIHAHALFGRHLEGQINREAVSVMQRKRVFTAEGGRRMRLLARFPGLLDCRVQDRRARGEGVHERFFFTVRNI